MQARTQGFIMILVMMTSGSTIFVMAVITIRTAVPSVTTGATAMFFAVKLIAAVTLLGHGPFVKLVRVRVVSRRGVHGWFAGLLLGGVPTYSTPTIRQTTVLHWLLEWVTVVSCQLLAMICWKQFRVGILFK